MKNERSGLGHCEFQHLADNDLMIPTGIYRMACAAEMCQCIDQSGLPVGAFGKVLLKGTVPPPLSIVARQPGLFRSQNADAKVLAFGIDTKMI